MLGLFRVWLDPVMRRNLTKSTILYPLWRILRMIAQAHTRGVFFGSAPEYMGTTGNLTRLEEVR